MAKANSKNFELEVTVYIIAYANGESPRRGTRVVACNSSSPVAEMGRAAASEMTAVDAALHCRKEAPSRLR